MKNLTYFQGLLDISIKKQWKPNVFQRFSWWFNQQTMKTLRFSKGVPSCWRSWKVLAVYRSQMVVLSTFKKMKDLHISMVFLIFPSKTMNPLRFSKGFDISFKKWWEPYVFQRFSMFLPTPIYIIPKRFPSCSNWSPTLSKTSSNTFHMYPTTIPTLFNGRSKATQRAIQIYATFTPNRFHHRSKCIPNI